MFIEHTDEYKIWDKLIQESSIKNPLKFGPLGWVQIFINNNLVEEKSNLVVAQGREIVAQKISNIIMTTSGTNAPKDYRGYSLTHFGIGGGGAVANGDTFTLEGPAICDTSMYRPITLGVTSYLNEPGNYDAGSTSLYRYINSVKAVSDATANTGTVQLEAVGYPEGDPTPDCQNYTKIKYTCIVPSGEPGGLAAGASIQISEAGLYMVSGTDAVLFSHICFSPKFKELEAEFKIIWYILC